MNNKNVTKTGYNMIAQQYYEEYKDDDSDFPYIDTFLKECGNNILDLGCGMGQYSKYMSEKGFSVVGMDFSKSMLDIAKKYAPKANFIEGDVSDLPPNLRNDFDGVLIAFLLHHISKDEAKKMFKDLRSHLVEDANVLILYRKSDKKDLGDVFLEEEPWAPQIKYEIKEYSENEIDELLNDSGFEIKSTQTKGEIEDEFSLAGNVGVIHAKAGYTKKLSSKKV